MVSAKNIYTFTFPHIQLALQTVPVTMDIAAV